MLYLGTNYHPHDWPRERWPEDIRLMKKCGVTLVRMGHLCWDSFEPEEGEYIFEWFDEVMDLMAQAGIGVVLDLSTRPAPAWVHRKCPGVNIVSAGQNAQAPLRRYTEDVADPEYQAYALRFAEKLIRRYRHHPALFAWGLCNELGDGYDSYSEASRQRFIRWLREKYGTVEKWNQAWATHRWSRRMTRFEDVRFPVSEIAQGQPEALLDMRRFFSDGIAEYLGRLHDLARTLSPEIPTSSNHYAEKTDFGFDYQKICPHAVDVPGIGFYPGPVVGAYDRMNLFYYHHRLMETGKPMWCLEFQTGCKGLQHPPRGVNRMYHLLTLLYRSEMSLAWTWRTLYGGEEQFLYGVLNHDGTPGPNYEELRQVSRDFQKLGKYAFPYLPQCEAAVAYSQESYWQEKNVPWQYRQNHREAASICTDALFRLNHDCNVVDLRRMTGCYRVLIVPGMSLMEEASADTIRRFVREGGICLMTAQSAQVNAHGQVFPSPMPGLLTDVFGLRVTGFERPESAEMPRTLGIEGRSIPVKIDFFEHLELRGAESLAAWEKGECALSMNPFGQGLAMYLGTTPDRELITLLIQWLMMRGYLSETIATPEGVYAREIAPGQVYYVNTTAHEVTIQEKRSGWGVLREAPCGRTFALPPLDAELVVVERMEG